MKSTIENKLDLDDILEYLDWGEGEEIEFKSAKGGLPRSLWETYSSMANSKGGIILLGVEDDGSVSGIKDPAKIERDFWATINNRGKVSASLLTSKDVKVLNHPSGFLLAIKVPRAFYKSRPVFIGQNPLTGTYRRNADGDFLCNDQEVRRMLIDSSENSADKRILNGFKFEDLDLESLQQFRNRFSAFYPSHPWLSKTDRDLLKKIGGWRAYESEEEQGLTLAGLLMFGKDEAIRDGCYEYHVDYRERLSEDPQIRWTDRLHPDGTWPGNLFQFYIRVIQKLSVDLKTPFKLDDELFRKGESPVHVAVREALVNALIHSDFHGQGGIIIEKYKDRFELSNAGTMLISYEELAKGGVSICRNRSLQLMFSLIGASEKAGTGIDKIRAGWSSQHWRDPMVRETTRPDRVKWTLPLVSLIPEESLAVLKQRYGKEFAKFNQHEIQALVTAQLEESVDNRRMCEITQLHPRDVTVLLQSLVSKKALTPLGQGRWTRYVLPKINRHSMDYQIHVSSDRIHVSSDPEQISELTNNQWDELVSIAQTARMNKNLPSKTTEELILKLCSKSWLTRKQLSVLLQRNSISLRSRFLTTMVRHNLLTLKYPESPNRTDQAYKTMATEESSASQSDSKTFNR